MISHLFFEFQHTHWIPLIIDIGDLFLIVIQQFPDTLFFLNQFLDSHSFLLATGMTLALTQTATLKYGTLFVHWLRIALLLCYIINRDRNRTHNIIVFIFWALFLNGFRSWILQINLLTGTHILSKIWYGSTLAQVEINITIRLATLVVEFIGIVLFFVIDKFLKLDGTHFGPFVAWFAIDELFKLAVFVKFEKLLIDVVGKPIINNILQNSFNFLDFLNIELRLFLIPSIYHIFGHWWQTWSHLHFVEYPLHFMHVLGVTYVFFFFEFII